MLALAELVICWRYRFIKPSCRWLVAGVSLGKGFGTPHISSGGAARSMALRWLVAASAPRWAWPCVWGDCADCYVRAYARVLARMCACMCAFLLVCERVCARLCARLRGARGLRVPRRRGFWHSRGDINSGLRSWALCKSAYVRTARILAFQG